MWEGHRVDPAPPVYHEAVGIRYESWVHEETQLGRAAPVLSSSESWMYLEEQARGPLACLCPPTSRKRIPSPRCVEVTL